MTVEKISMINLNERMGPDRSRELTTSWSPVKRASDWATGPGDHRFVLDIVY